MPGKKKTTNFGVDFAKHKLSCSQFITAQRQSLFIGQQMLNQLVQVQQLERIGEGRLSVALLPEHCQREELARYFKRTTKKQFSATHFCSFLTDLEIHSNTTLLRRCNSSACWMSGKFTATKQEFAARA